MFETIPPGCHGHSIWLSSRHDGMSLADAMIYILDRANVTSKVYYLLFNSIGAK